ncbi:hypothetical protein [Ollibium composti]|uniref:hypothetical protein n=1 Tax=Ollibium composti TaxID=2675109 RepID=UPI001E64961B|nr:hypothetical protein [Mesorhizobium composti]
MQFIGHRQIIEGNRRLGARLLGRVGRGEKVVEQRGEIPLGSDSDGDLPEKIRELAGSIAAAR